MNIILLTHQRELAKTSNTGKLVADVLGKRARVLVWERKHPDPELMQTIERGKVALLYPMDDSVGLTRDMDFESYIVLDATWQEARKMYNLSPYLKELPKIKIQPKAQSIYRLRRNQRADGLCTAESVAEILAVKGALDKADRLMEDLLSFILNKKQLSS